MRVPPKEHPLDMHGRAVIVTGGEGMLGRQWCKALRSVGAIVRSWDCTGIDPVDITDPAAIRKALDYLNTMTRSAAGGGTYYDDGKYAPDALICAAALDAKPGTMGRDPYRDWDDILRVNLTGVKTTCEVVGAEMARHGGGSIVLVSSIYGIVAPDPRRYGRGFTKPAAYSASKAALIGLAKYWAAYWGKDGVRVNAVVLGGVDQEEQPTRFRRAYESSVPMGRFARVDEYDGLMQFLCSDLSSYMTGSVIVADGGLTAW